jgi:hypothetical protein
MLRIPLAAGLLVATLGAAAAAEPVRVEGRGAAPVAQPEAIRLDDRQLDQVAAGNVIIFTAGWLAFGAGNIGWSIGTGVQYFLLGGNNLPN